MFVLVLGGVVVNVLTLFCIGFCPIQYEDVYCSVME